METSKILSADLLDLLFDGRNKDYGAYELRKTYRKRILYAVTATFIICLLLIVVTIIAKNSSHAPTQIFVKDLELEKLPPQEEKKIEPPPIPPKQEQKVEIAQFTPPKIAPDEEVKPDEQIKDMDKLDDTKIGNINQEGAKDDGIIAPPIEKAIGPVDAPKKDDDYDKIFPTVQYVAEFPGGSGAWNRYLERNLNSNLPADNGAPVGKYTVTVSFIVNKQGDISDVQAENDPGYGTKAEAIRVIQKSLKWKPAMQNGRNVIYRQRQSITFQVSND